MPALQSSETSTPVAFRAFRQFNEPSWRPRAGVDYRLDGNTAAWFPAASRADQFARALAKLEAFPVKELVESFEFFERVRHRLRAPHVADLCCGHGLVGLLFAIFEREVEKVTLLDHHMPPLFPRIWEVVCDFAPWVRAKVNYLEKRLSHAYQLPPSTSIVAVHACGARSDRCLDIALSLGSNVALLPCCYGQTGQDAPLVLRQHLGVTLATDVQRTYTLENKGYTVTWSAIPAEITPMNRIICAVPRPPGGVQTSHLHEHPVQWEKDPDQGATHDGDGTAEQGNGPGYPSPASP